MSFKIKIRHIGIPNYESMSLCDKAALPIYENKPLCDTPVIPNDMKWDAWNEYCLHGLLEISRKLYETNTEYSIFNELHREFKNMICELAKEKGRKVELISQSNHESLNKLTSLEMVWRDENEMDSLSPREFENMICELLKKKGYDAELTKQTRDGGKDIIIRHYDLGDTLILIECKKYAPNRAVGSDMIQKLIGTMVLSGATKAVMYTTSYFSKCAKKLVETVRNRLTLYDRKALLEQINQVMCVV